MTDFDRLLAFLEGAELPYKSLDVAGETVDDEGKKDGGVVWHIQVTDGMVTWEFKQDGTLLSVTRKDQP